MIDLENSCILCDSKTDLNTKMEVSHNDKSYILVICEKCEDDASPKKVRKKLEFKINSIEEFIKQGEELGLNVQALRDMLEGKTLSNKVIPAREDPPELKQQPKTTSQTPQQRKTKEPPRLLDDDGRPIGGQTIWKRELQAIEAPMSKGASSEGRIPIALPKVEVGNTGTTRFTINKVTNEELIARTRGMNERGTSEYVKCPTCDGAGTVGQDARKCPGGCNNGLLG